jgi:hypothetical protein
MTLMGALRDPQGLIYIETILLDKPLF